jgi:hypothetical protein
MIPTHGATSGGAALFSTPPLPDVAPTIEEDSLEMAAALLGTSAARVRSLLHLSGQTVQELIDDAEQQLQAADAADSEEDIMFFAAPRHL